MATRQAARFLLRMVRPVVGRGGSAAGFFRFFRDYRRFRGMGGQAWLADLHPVFEDPGHHSIDPHYFNQAVWAFTRILADKPDHHTDVGSQALFVGMLSAAVPVTFVDIRPLGVKLPNLQEVRASVLGLPFGDRSTRSVSCLHVIEHVGLGRYGDPIAPDGAVLAARELERVLAPGGRLYLSVPVGQPRIEFNAHRVFAPAAVRDMFGALRLAEFAVVSDRGETHLDPPIDAWGAERYACGMFLFTRDV